MDPIEKEAEAQAYIYTEGAEDQVDDSLFCAFVAGFLRGADFQNSRNAKLFYNE